MRKRRNTEEPADVNVTPLLDIVFIMLIFFIVTATFVFEDGVAPNLPQPDPPETDAPPPPSILLTVREDGFVLVDDTRQVDPRSVRAVVQEFLAKETKGVVVINALPQSRTGVTMLVLDQARIGAGPNRYNKISLALASS